MALTVQLLSDLHLEFHQDEGRSFLESLDPSGVDVLVVAGDIHLERGLSPTLSYLCARYPRVLFVAGNHEYYQSSPQRIHMLLGRLDASIRNFTWLHHKMVEIEGVKIGGTTMWFPRPGILAKRYKHNLNDFRLISGFEPWVYQEHDLAQAFLESAAPRVDVLVTHHIPTQQGVSERHKNSPLNHYFCHDLTRLIEREGPPYWLFGHTHDRFDFTIGKTRLLANPFGYPHEQGDPDRGIYQEKLLLTVG